MYKLIINDDNLKDEDIDKSSIKVRAILYENNNILVANYNGVYLLPGGKIDNNESIIEALQRELLEETGIFYDSSEFIELLLLRYYQKDYQTVDDLILNRKIDTYYYYSKYRGIDLNNIRRTKSEIEGNFKLELVDINSLNRESDNPRNKYFKRELEEVIKVYKKVK